MSRQHLRINYFISKQEYQNLAFISYFTTLLYRRRRKNNGQRCFQSNPGGNVEAQKRVNRFVLFLFLFVIAAPPADGPSSDLEYRRLLLDPFFLADMLTEMLVWIIMGFNEPSLEPSLEEVMTPSWPLLIAEPSRQIKQNTWLYLSTQRMKEKFASFMI